RTVRSRQADASCRPSPLNATHKTAPLCSSGEPTPSPVSTSQIRTVPSALAEATCLPLGLTATQRITQLWPEILRIGLSFPRSQIRTIPSQPPDTSRL